MESRCLQLEGQQTHTEIVRTGTWAGVAGSATATVVLTCLASDGKCVSFGVLNQVSD